MASCRKFGSKQRALAVYGYLEPYSGTMKLDLSAKRFFQGWFLAQAIFNYVPLALEVHCGLRNHVNLEV